MPEANVPKQAIPGLEVLAVRRLDEAIRKVRDLA